MGEQDVADQRGAFFCAEGDRPVPPSAWGGTGRPLFALGAPAPLPHMPPPSCVQAVEAPRAPCGRRGGSVY